MPTGDAPTTSEWSTILLPTKVRLILEVWRYDPDGGDLVQWLMFAALCLKVIENLIGLDNPSSQVLYASVNHFSTWRHNGRLASQITSLTIVYSTVYSDADQRKHQSSASLAFVRGIHRGPVISPHKWPVTRSIWRRHHAKLPLSQTNGNILLIGALATNLCEIGIEIRRFSYKKIIWKYRLQNDGDFVSVWRW